MTLSIFDTLPATKQLTKQLIKNKKRAIIGDEV